MEELLQIELRNDRDLVAARQRARRVAALLGFESQDQARISTVVSEIARNALCFAGGGRVQFHCGPQRELVVRVVDRGPGIDNLPAILDGRAGNGAGLATARRLMDRCQIDTSAEGTTVTLAKALPRKGPAVDADLFGAVRRQLAGEEPDNVYDEFASQNQQLLVALDEVRQQQARMAQLNAELEETNRGVVALYADLEEKAEALQRLVQQKTRFYSSMSHEFRTPINSIISIVNILLARLDGELTAEQVKQVGLIQKSAKNLLEWITDLLDLAKVEAGKLEVRPSEFSLADLFASLRGVMRPLISTPAVELVVEEPADEIVAYSDEGQLTQILRNFVSNAIKFTERGEIRVQAEVTPRDWLRVSVSDTGIGIAPQFHQGIFEEFSQVENPLQRRARGTGLGLSLSKRLAQLLGGDVSVRSAPGAGSTFSVEVPRIFRPSVLAPADVGTESAPAAGARTAGESLVLVVDDDEASRYVARQTISHLGLSVAEAVDGAHGLALARTLLPRAIVLDVVMPDMSGLDVLEALQADDQTRRIPVILRTSKPVETLDRARLHATAGVVSKHPETGSAELEHALRSTGIVTDKPVAEVDYA